MEARAKSMVVAFALTFAACGGGGGGGNDGPSGCGKSGQFVDNCDGTVTDTVTGLMWEKKTGTNDGPVIDCNDAATCPDPHEVRNYYTWTLREGTGKGKTGSVWTVFLAQLNTEPCFAGHCDWKIPGMYELAGADWTNFGPAGGIADLSAPGCGTGGACIDPIFGPTAPDRYWSGTTTAITETIWQVDFETGYTEIARNTFTANVRAYRQP